MNKTIIGVISVIIISLFLINKDTKFLVSEGISLRVIANSDSAFDQEMKLKVKEKVQADLYTLLDKTTNLTEASRIIQSNLAKIDFNLKQYLKEKNYNLDYVLDFGYYYYPGKEYKGVKYKGGYYESLLIKLGKGEGNNWWCILFPPLCLLEAEEATVPEYKFWVKEVIENYFGKRSQSKL